ncbi:MAG TPA: MBL fold metallo-hydrolase [Geminicoccaceae bacterium]|nr:MBL fold metallo-hydrolase [Geminicoccaceae bacterium]
MAVNNQFWVRFWGVRGTVPCPGPDTLRYGGNTACVEVMCGHHRLILDAGTGLRALGATLNSQKGLKAHIFLTHTHIDHINGFPFFRPAYSPTNRFELWAGHLGGQTGALQAVLADLMRAPIFPVPLDIMHACIAFHDFAAGAAIQAARGVVLRTAPLNHPNGATGYRVEYGGKSVCYVTDTEHREGELDGTIVELIRGSQIVIYDATYTEAEYPRYRGWGHSTWSEGVRLCRAAGAKRLIAFHHDPDHDDAALDEIAAQLGRAMPGSEVAQEGMVLHP